jgi:exosome complex RNA-binding protein Csl4
MSDKLGRNDQCYCGSGKKYKKCCIDKNQNNLVIVDFAWQKLRKTEEEVINEHLLPYLDKELNEKLEGDAWFLFSVGCEWPDENLDKLYDQMFIPWFLFNWVYEALDEKESSFNLIVNKTIAENYLLANDKNTSQKKLSKYQRAFIEEMNKAYYSFYIINDIVPGKELILKDIFLQTTHIVKEKIGSYYLKKGNIVFTQIVTIDGQSIFIGMAPYIVGAVSHAELLECRKALEQETKGVLTTALLRKEYEAVLFDKYFSIINRSFAGPILYNSDGENIIFYRLYYDLSISVQEAFEKLLPITAADDKKYLLSEAKKDREGNIISIEFPWLKGAIAPDKANKLNKVNKMHKTHNFNMEGSVILGNITIERKKLVAEVNSKERSNVLEILLKDYLGSAIDQPKILIETIEQKLASEESSKNSVNNKSNSNHKSNSITNTNVLPFTTIHTTPADNDDLRNMPEIQSYIKELSDKYWLEWFDEIIPMLGNKTPREASKTEEGRELLESLLLHYEQTSNKKNKNANNTDKNILEPDIAFLRQELGL